MYWQHSYLASGNVLDCTWKDGMAHGKGVLKNVNGTLFEGEYKDGKCKGEEVMQVEIYVNVLGRMARLTAKA